tara:strand:+ start:516 stop:824 length:309 start_codon:yes stop_codon:yes gene_type:complete
MEFYFKKFFKYVLGDYCEDTCTAQDELAEIIDELEDVEELAELFIDEGFLKWTPSEFICLAGNVEGYEEGRLLDNEEACTEQYWEGICRMLNIDFDDILEYL